MPSERIAPRRKDDKEKVDKIERHLLKLTPPKSTPVMALIEINFTKKSTTILIPIRYGVASENMTENWNTRIAFVTLYNQRNYQPKVAVHEWATSAGTKILEFWNLAPGEKVDQFEVKVSKGVTNGVAYENICFNPEPMIFSTSANKLVGKFEKSFSDWKVERLDLDKFEPERPKPVPHARFYH